MKKNVFYLRRFESGATFSTLISPRIRHLKKTELSGNLKMKIKKQLKSFFSSFEGDVESGNKYDNHRMSSEKMADMSIENFKKLPAKKGDHKMTS